MNQGDRSRKRRKRPANPRGLMLPRRPSEEEMRARVARGVAELNARQKQIQEGQATTNADSNKSDVQKYVVQVNAKFEAEIANLTNQLKVKQIDLKVKQIDMKNSKRQLKVKRMEFKEFKNRGKILLATFA